MSPEILLLVMALAVVGMAWYANSSKRDKIFCRFKRVNKTQIAKFVRMSSRYVVFDKQRYDIIPSCIVFEWWDKGLVHMLFPQWVASLDFTHTSRYPHDPNTLKPVIISPEVRAVMDKEEWTKSYARSSVPKTGKAQQSILQQYLPFIAIGLVVVIGFYLYQNMKGLEQHMAVIENTLKAITR